MEGPPVCKPHNRSLLWFVRQRSELPWFRSWFQTNLWSRTGGSLEGCDEGMKALGLDRRPPSHVSDLGADSNINNHDVSAQSGSLAMIIIFSERLLCSSSFLARFLLPAI